MASLYTLGIAIFAAIGTFLFVRHPYDILSKDENSRFKGFDTGIATTSKDTSIDWEPSIPRTDTSCSYRPSELD